MCCCLYVCAFALQKKKKKRIHALNPKLGLVRNQYLQRVGRIGEAVMMPSESFLRERRGILLESAASSVRSVGLVAVDQIPNRPVSHMGWGQFWTM